MDHICSHEMNRIQLANQRGEAPKFVFCLNLQVPHSKSFFEMQIYSMVLYYIPTDDLVESLLFGDGTTTTDTVVPPGFQDMFKKFMLSDDDEYRYVLARCFLFFTQDFASPYCVILPVGVDMY